jgi:CBS-domain-containing membrane protein|tara:strand:+ start:20438 stop:20905 length:468 start_codon:yes stop_codon:yes gene_type:complete
MKNIFNKKTILNNLLSAFGAFLCISLLSYLHFSQNSSIWLIPPFGASMVLVMAVHNSPLAEPKNIFLGHTLSALSGVVIFALMGSSFISLGIAVGLAVFVMATFDSIHPPAGANPIIAILGGKGLSFVLMPVALGAIVIILFALFYNKLLGRDYP